MEWYSSPECTELMPPMDDFSNSLSVIHKGVAVGAPLYERGAMRTEWLCIGWPRPRVAADDLHAWCELSTDMMSG
jgi:hypothetical protein